MPLLGRCAGRLSYRLIHAADGEAGFDRLQECLAADLGTLDAYDIYLCAPGARVRDFGLALEDRLGARDSRLAIEPVRCG